MYGKVNYTLVGLFVVLFTAGLFLFGFWLAKYGFEQKYDYYLLYFHEPVEGLSPDSSVKLNGVDVGKVLDIEVVPPQVDRTRVTIRLKAGTPVTSDMYATLKPQGITGLSYVEILGGKSGARPLKPLGGKFPEIPTRPSLIYRLTEEAPKWIDTISSTLDRIDRLLSDSNLQTFDAILDNAKAATAGAATLETRLSALAEDLNASLAKITAKVTGSAEKLDRFSERTARLSQTLNRQLPGLLKRFDRAAKRFAKLGGDLDRSLRRGDYNVRAILRPIQIDVKELSYRYQELAQELKNLSHDPSQIIFGGVRPPKGPGE